MLDTYREKEQRGAHCTPMEDHVLVEWPCGWTCEEYYEGWSRCHGPMLLQVRLTALKKPVKGTWWQRLRWWLWPIGAGEAE